MAQVQFVPVQTLKRYVFSQYTQGSVAAFATQFNTDWASVLPAGGAISISGKTGAATVAEIVISANLVLEVNPTDWVGFNGGAWQVVPNSSMGRTVADGATTSASNVVTSATAAFVSPADVGAIIATPNLPSGTTILTVSSGTQVTVSNNATATGTSQALTITRTTAQFIPDVV